MPNKYKIIYIIGCIILFLGLLWMFLPHRAHNSITQEDETEHYIHLIQGLIATIIGLLIMIFTEKIINKNH